MKGGWDAGCDALVISYTVIYLYTWTHIRDAVKVVSTAMHGSSITVCLWYQQLSSQSYGGSVADGHYGPSGVIGIYLYDGEYSPIRFSI